MNEQLKEALKECFEQPIVGKDVQYKFFTFSEKTEQSNINIVKDIISKIEDENIYEILFEYLQGMCHYSYIKGYADGLKFIKEINTE